MYAPARDVAERTWSEEAVVYIDALLVFLKIVVGFWVKVDGFRTFGGANSKIQLVRVFLLFGRSSLQIWDEPYFSCLYPCEIVSLQKKISFWRGISSERFVFLNVVYDLNT